ncbi:MAG: GNAT family N-acetyltransferase [Oscillospiraceae bacterium]|jgi:RimJ/RimL family protein N-acetyltransferase|nr:GNAT family N-acetyltransferase [Oscillospiraceae bacterium]
MDYPEKTVLLKNGKTCLLRRPEEKDAEMLLRFQKESSGETPYLVVGPEDIDWTAEQQVKRIERWNVSPDRLRLLAEVDGELAGVAVVYANNPQTRLRHRCSIDITLYKKFWSQGIGTALMGEILTAAGTAGYERAELEVVSANAPALALYRKFGFEATGTVPEAVKYNDGTYADFLFMTKRL